MDNLHKAMQLLSDDINCALVSGQQTYTSAKRGISPMMDFISQKIDLRGYSAADKIVGRAVAFLFILAGVKEVYAAVLSKPALELLEKNGISVSYETLTDKIIRRDKMGICPMEEAVQNIDNPEEAYATLAEKLKSMSSHQSS